MPMTASFISEEERLDLCFEGTLDLRLAMDICDICKHLSASLQSCIIDLHGVDRVFDSGVALLQMLCARAQRLGAIVLVLSDDPKVRRRIPVILSTGDISQDAAPRRRLRPMAPPGGPIGRAEGPKRPPGTTVASGGALRPREPIRASESDQ
jgi:ABC-type transporter Mla MlaB component